jgi:hypothetical protein
MWEMNVQKPPQLDLVNTFLNGTYSRVWSSRSSPTFLEEHTASIFSVEQEPKYGTCEKQLPSRGMLRSWLRVCSVAGVHISSVESSDFSARVSI